MRDLILAGILLLALPVSLVRPFLAVALFAWISLMNPHRLSWGFAYDMPWAQLYAAAAAVSILLIEPRYLLDSLRRYWLPFSYLAWMFITTMMAANQEEAWRLLKEAWKIHLMCMLTLAVLTNRRRIIAMTAVVTGSIAFYGVKGGLFTLQGGGGLIWGPPSSAIADNNHLAAALVMVLPLLYWAGTIVTRRWQRIGLFACQGLIAVSILGSGSRGAFLAVLSVGAMLVMRGKNWFRAALVVLIVGAAAAAVMPDSYWKRIDTISQYEQDGSAMGRIHTWKIATRIANEQITGAGFSYYGTWIYARHADNPEQVHSSHSIYFQALGEHGWIGLMLFLAILTSFWRQCARLIARAGQSGDEVIDRLARMMQVSLVGYMSAGLFVNIGNWDGLYFMYAIVLSLSRRQEQADQAQEQTPTTTMTGASPPWKAGSSPAIGRQRA